MKPNTINAALPVTFSYDRNIAKYTRETATLSLSLSLSLSHTRTHKHTHFTLSRHKESVQLGKAV